MSHNDSSSVGKILQSARKSKGLTVADVVRLTKIRYSHIQALENDDYSNLPETTYSMGYIVAYARILDLDSAQLVEQAKAQCATKDSAYDNIVQNNRLDKEYNPANIIKENFIDFIFIILTFGFKRAQHGPIDKDQEVDKVRVTPGNSKGNIDTNFKTKKEVAPVSNNKSTNVDNAQAKGCKKISRKWKIIIFGSLLLLGVLILSGLLFLRHYQDISIEQEPIAIKGNVAKELDVNKFKDEFYDDKSSKDSYSVVDKSAVSPEESKVVAPVISHHNSAKEEDNLSEWPKTDKPSLITLDASDNVWVKVYQKEDPTKVYLNTILKKGAKVVIPNVDGLVMDVGNFKRVTLVVKGEDRYLENESKNLVMRRIPLNDKDLEVFTSDKPHD